ncbi:hypothetical protein CRU99_01810 [Malaciobacter mytili]|uniref:hypothetical protein n=1 Tax=Malaciobacter mytili TaxID=603050 RepID=UPI00100A853C|nr:hypothetical protein [Malaciobacter mytili]RXI48020.1 hypothetical protein CRU99_01810 [Malaciobacter mytili]
MVELICKILKIGKASYYRYKKADEPILSLIKYFSKEELLELQNNSKITRLELIKDFSNDQIEMALKYFLIEKIQKENTKNTSLESENIEIKKEIQKLNETLLNMNQNINKISEKINEDSFSIYQDKSEQKIAKEDLQKLIKKEYEEKK